MKRIILALPFLIAGTGSIGRTAPAETRALALSELFRPGVVFQDHNGDGVVDCVAARIVLAEKPSAGELAAAADIAARLGYETTDMNLPIRMKPDTTDKTDGARALQSDGTRDPQFDGARAFQVSETDTGATIFIGAKSLAQANVTADAIGGSGVKAGDGLISAFTLSGKPAVAVLGGDDDGLSAAAVMLAGHLPHVWDHKGSTTYKIAHDAREI